jgi:hypothetical protein
LESVWLSRAYISQFVQPHTVTFNETGNPDQVRKMAQGWSLKMDMHIDISIAEGQLYVND